MLLPRRGNEFMNDDEQRIRELAHSIWEQEGRPEGQAERHWRMAEAAIATGDRPEQGTEFQRPLDEKLTDPSLDITRNPYEPLEPGPV